LVVLIVALTGGACDFAAPGQANRGATTSPRINESVLGVAIFLHERIFGFFQVLNSMPPATKKHTQMQSAQFNCVNVLWNLDYTEVLEHRASNKSMYSMKQRCILRLPHSPAMPPDVKLGVGRLKEGGKRFPAELPVPIEPHQRADVRQ